MKQDYSFQHKAAHWFQWRLCVVLFWLGLTLCVQQPHATDGKQNSPILTPPPTQAPANAPVSPTQAPASASQKGTILPEISVITSRNFSFLNAATAIELTVAVNQGDNMYWLRATLFNNESIFLHGNPQPTITSQLLVQITGSPGNYTLKDATGSAVQDIVIQNKQGLRQLTYAPKASFYLKSLLQRFFSFLHSDCSTVSLIPSQTAGNNIYELSSSCDIGYGFSKINTLNVRMTNKSGYNMTDTQGQVISNISNLNGTLQFDYGVNGPLAFTPIDPVTGETIQSQDNSTPQNALVKADKNETSAANKANAAKADAVDALHGILSTTSNPLNAVVIQDDTSLDIPKLTPTEAKNAPSLSVGTLSLLRYAKFRSMLGAGASNPLTNTPNFYHITSQNFSFLNTCTSVSLTSTASTATPSAIDARNYRITATCRDAPEHPVTLDIQLTGQNGRYALTDQTGQQIKDIQYRNGLLQPVYETQPNLLTLIARNYSCFHPYKCLRNAFTLTQQSNDPFYIDGPSIPFALTGTCSNGKGLNLQSTVYLSIGLKKDGFVLTDATGNPISDIITQNGQLSTAPLLNALTAYPAHDFKKSCINATLTPTQSSQNIANQQPITHYTLKATCADDNAATKLSTIDLILNERGGVFTAMTTAGAVCARITNIKGTLSCQQ